jgi:hypothetical protein
MSGCGGGDWYISSYELDAYGQMVWWVTHKLEDGTEERWTIQTEWPMDACDALVEAMSLHDSLLEQRARMTEDG